MKRSIFKTSVISLSILAIASAPAFALTQSVSTQNINQAPVQESQLQAHHPEDDYEDYEMEMDFYLEDYKEGYRDGFADGFMAALEELESMYFEDGFFEDFEDFYGDDDWQEDDWGEEDWEEDVEFLDTAPDGLSPTYLPEGLAFDEAYSYTDEDGITDEGAFYFNEDTGDYLDVNRLNISIEEATELYGEDFMADIADLPTKEIAGTVVYLESMTEDGESYSTAYFSKADGLYTVDSNLSDAEMNVVLSSLLGQ